MSVLAVYDCMLFLMYAARPERVHETFELIDDRRVTYCLSAEVIAEIRDVLTRPKHQQRFPGLTRSRVDEVIAEISRQAHFVKMVPDLYQLERDPKDSKYINLALSAGARYLVTRDNDLLDLMNEALPTGAQFRLRFPHLAILHPAAFVAAIGPSAT